MISVLLFVIFNFCQFFHRLTASNPRLCDVEKFVDGDTFWVNDGSPKGLKLRLIGINSPEPRAYLVREKSFMEKRI